jgi:alpha-ketoglutarate-dependent taurine dioxygenase
METITSERLSDGVGARIKGVDRERLLNDEDLPAFTLSELEQNGVLVFNDLHVDDETQVAFSKRLGRVEKIGHGDNPEIFKVTLDPKKNRAADYLRSTFDWHIDGCTDDIPIMATVLSARVVANEGGDTAFASTYGAYDNLSDEEKEYFETVRVVHTFEASQRLSHPNPSDEEVEMWRRRPSKTHPLVWTHNDGRKSLVIGATADHVVGLEPDESDALLADLLERSTQPEAVYRHQWTVGDMVIWDNRGVLHRACRYKPTSAREMHRTTLTGEEAIA